MLSKPKERLLSQIVAVLRCAIGRAGGWKANLGRRLYLLLDEIQSNPANWNLVRPTKRGHLAPARFVRVLGLRAPIKLDMAIVLQTTAESWGDDLGAFDLSITVRGCQGRGHGKKLVHVSGALPGLQNRRYRKRRVEAVGVPVERTDTTGDDGSGVSGSLLTGVA